LNNVLSTEIKKENRGLMKQIQVRMFLHKINSTETEKFNITFPINPEDLKSLFKGATLKRFKEGF